MLGGQESFQPENYQQLLRIGRQLQILEPEEIQSYQSAQERFNWNLNQLQGSVNTYITVRDRLRGQLQGQQYRQALDNLIFGQVSTLEKEEIDWWQLFKDLVASSLGSYKYAPEVLGELWEQVKAHWPTFVGLTVALIVGEKAVVALAGAPEPTFLTKVAAVALQSLIAALYGVSIVVETVNAAAALSEWFTIASTAKGNPDKIEEASKAFLRGIGHLLLVILASKAFQTQISPQRLAALQAMLGRVRGQGTLRLPDGTPTIDLYPDPDHPGSYVLGTPQSPNPSGSGGNLLPPSSVPPVSIQPPPTAPSSGGSPLTTTGGATAGSLSQTPPTIQVPGSSLIPGEITPGGSSIPAEIAPPEQTTFAESPQQLDIVPNLGLPPSSSSSVPDTPGVVGETQLVPGTEPTQEITSGSGQTTSPPSSQPSTNLEPLGNLLSQILGTLSAQDLVAASQGKLLTNSQIQQLVQSAGNWDQVKINYLSYSELMGQIIDYRTLIIFQVVTERSIRRRSRV